MLEWLAVSMLLTSGFLLGRALGFRKWWTAALAMPLGVAAFVTVGLLLVTLSLPTWPVLALVVSFVATGAVFAVAVIRDRAVAGGLPQFVTVLGVASVAHVVTRVLHLVNWHTDSLFNVESALLLAYDKFELVSPDAAAKRLLSLPLTLGLAAQLGDGVYIEVFAPLLSLSLLGLISLLLATRVRAIGRIPAVAGVIVALMLLVSNSRYIFHTFYVNGHLLFATFLTVVVGLLWLRVSADPERAPSSRSIWAVAAVLPALTVTRAEAALVIVLVVVAAWSLPIATREKTVLTVTAGLSSVAWHGWLTIVNFMDRGSAPLASYGLLALGAILAVAPLVLSRLPSRVLQVAPALVEIAVWLALLFYVVRRPELGARSLYATAVNLLTPAGGWGFSLVALAVVGVLALLLLRGDRDRILRYPLSTFVPLAFLLVYLRGAPYRVGDGDSLNRMWMQFLPLLVIFIVERFLTGAPRFRASERVRKNTPISVDGA